VLKHVHPVLAPVPYFIIPPTAFIMKQRHHNLVLHHLLILSLWSVPVFADAKPLESTCSVNEVRPTAGDIMLQHGSVKKSSHLQDHGNLLHEDDNPSHEESDSASLHQDSTSAHEDDKRANMTLSAHEKLFEDRFCTDQPKKKRFIDQFDGGTISLSTTLDEAGFKKVAAEKNEKEMKTYIRRVAESCNMKVINEGGLNGAATWMTEKTGSFLAIKKALFKALLAASKDHWVSLRNNTQFTGSNASLDYAGYAQVRALRSKKEMVIFVRRLIDHMGVRITDEGGFGGLISFYTDPDDSQSVLELIPEIKKAAFDHTWAELDMPKKV
jgi:hypothetical protein